MQSRLFLLCCAVIVSTSITFAQGKRAVPEKNESKIKTLSSEQINGYLNGEEMEMARVAELNHYPGPRQILDLAEKLRLSSRQVEQVADIVERIQDEAMRLGRLIVEREEMLNKMFEADTIDQAILDQHVKEIAALQGELRFVHLSANVETRSVMTARQLQRYIELRGSAKAKVQSPTQPRIR